MITTSVLTLAALCVMPNATNDASREIAQRAANAIDFLDSDSVMTRLRFGDQEVWGVEHPDLRPEPLAFHDRADGNRDISREIAQRAANAIDFLDSDSVMTRLRFGDQEVWGVERPNLRSEPLAFHDRRSADDGSELSTASTSPSNATQKQLIIQASPQPVWRIVIADATP